MIEMKKVISIVLALMLFASITVSVYAEEENSLPDYAEWESDREELSTECPTLNPDASANPSFKVLNSISVTFYITNRGTACLSYVISSNSKEGVTVKAVIEKKTMGIFWNKVGDGWTDKDSKKYINDSHTRSLAESGEYRVVLKITAEHEKYERIVYATYDKSVVKGDANLDNRLTASDARLILRHCAKLITLTASQKLLCDINGDGNITSADARITLRMSAGLV